MGWQSFPNFEGFFEKFYFIVIEMGWLVWFFSYLVTAKLSINMKNNRFIKIHELVKILLIDVRIKKEYERQT